MLSNKEQSYINIAINEAHKSDCQMMHGCVAVSNGKIIGRGYNHHRCCTHDGFILKNKYTCHAEISAIRNAHHNINSYSINIPNPKNIKKISLYIVRIDVNNNLKNSAPCIECTKILNKLGIKQIIYSLDNNNFNKIKTHQYISNHHSIGNR